MSDYNSDLFDIVSQLEFCGIKLTDAELLEKTFSTFHASNIVLQQQYRQLQFATYSDLISVLLTAEKVVFGERMRCVFFLNFIFCLGFA